MEQKPIYVRDLLGKALCRRFDETGVRMWDRDLLDAPHVQIILDLRDVRRKTDDDDPAQYMDRMVSSMQIVPYIAYDDAGEQYADAVLQIILT